MNTPPFLIAAALLFWGWRTGWWPAAAGLAVLIEASRFVKFRWEFTEKEYSRILDACTLLFAGAMIFLRFSERDKSGFVLFQWMPVVFALAMLTQAYAAQDKIPYRAFSWFLRRNKNKDEYAGGLNISYCYFGICLIAAGATNEKHPFFYPAVLILCAWAAWGRRIRRYTTPVWAACCLAVAAGGWVGQVGWTGLQAAMLPIFGELFARFAAKDFDAFHSRTAMGEIGSKKTSGKIVLRVKAEAGRVPQLLRQVSYDNLKDVMWTATKREAVKLASENDVTTWTLLRDRPTNDVVRVSGYLRGRKGLLSLPLGASRMLELPVVEVETTGLGVVRANEGPGVVSYLVEHAAGQSFDDAPNEEFDLRIPPAEKPVISEIAAEIKAAAGTNQQNLVKGVERFFAQNFSYSLYHKPNTVRDGTIIGRFLKTTRTGHCEYFASSTALLLRELGIPARYAVGYSVQEARGATYLVRERHAHAWTLAWLDGAWREVDTTPGTWVDAEREQASRFEPISDFFSELWFKFSKWRWLGQKGVISRVAPFLILPLVGILVWRIFFRKKRVESAQARREKMNWPGLDSEYYELEARIAATGHERHPHETPEQWLRRLKKDGVEHPSLPALVDLHYRYRFDPRGLATAERSRLRDLAKKDPDQQVK